MKITALSSIKKMLILFLVIAGLYFARDFLIPLAIGGVLATLFLPFCKWLETKRFPPVLAVFTCLLVLLTGVAAVALLFGWLVSDIASDLPLIKQKFIELSGSISSYIFERSGITEVSQIQLIKDQQQSASDNMGGIAGSFVTLFTNSILVLVYIFLLLYYRAHLLRFFLKSVPEEEQEETRQVIFRVAYVSQQYLVGLAKMIGCLWVMYSIGFSISGVKTAILFAILCGLLEIIPFIGNITGTTITVLVGALQGMGLPGLAGIVLTYGIVQFIQGWVLEPLILGHQVKINPMATIFALVIGQLVWGIPGIFLAIPLTAMFKIVCDHFEVLKPMGFLIGEVEKPKKRNRK